MAGTKMIADSLSHLHKPRLDKNTELGQETEYYEILSYGSNLKNHVHVPDGRKVTPQCRTAGGL